MYTYPPRRDVVELRGKEGKDAIKGGYAPFDPLAQHPVLYAPLWG